MSPEIIENSPEVWEKFFPNQQRRELAREFTERVSKLEKVARILVMESKRDEKKHQVFVITDESVPEGLEEKMLDIWEGICPPGTTLGVILGFPIVRTEIEFREITELSEFRDREVGILWQNQSI